MNFSLCLSLVVSLIDVGAAPCDSRKLTSEGASEVCR